MDKRTIGVILGALIIVGAWYLQGFSVGIDLPIIGHIDLFAPFAAFSDYFMLGAGLLAVIVVYTMSKQTKGGK